MTDPRAENARRREQFGLRADPAWLDHVDDVGTLVGEHGSMIGIPLTPDEHTEMRARLDGAIAVGRAVREADLDCAAGTWIDQRAGGVVHVLVAHPSVDERRAVDDIVAGHRAVIDDVEHSTRELDAVRALVGEESRQGTLQGAPLGYGIDVTANAVHLTVMEGWTPGIPASLRAAQDAGTLVIEFSDARFVEE